MVSTQNSVPFGFCSPVHNRERVGAMIAALARKLVMLAVLRYVDDYFGREQAETVAHATDCIARLVRLLLGSTAIADRKLEYGASLVILGVRL